MESSSKGAAAAPVAPNPPPQSNNLAPGLTSIIAACQRLYPDQKNPLQVTAVVKYWLGGPDPLDYISMFSHPGSEEILPHWHYVSCGLSDLHGDGRVHPPSVQGGVGEHPSGFGFELSIRVRKEPDQQQPPTWPASLLNSIAKYVFDSDNKLVTGDHINWGKPLGGPQSNLSHLLVADDPLLNPIVTPLGRVKFLQLVGITGEELRAVQRWNGSGVLQLLVGGGIQTGGSLLVTDISRKCVFSCVPSASARVEEGVAKEGSNLCGVAAIIQWTEVPWAQADNGQGKVEGGGSESLGNWSGLSAQCESLLGAGAGQPGGRVTFPKAVRLECSLETAKFLPLAIIGRLKHGFHFTFKAVTGEVAVTLVVEKVAGSLVSNDKPFAAQGDWLQVLIKDAFLDEFYNSVLDFESRIVCLPHTFQWPEQKMSLTVFAGEEPPAAPSVPS